jgi:two-component system LytT family response regulator
MSHIFRTILVDDERLARKELRSLLKDHPEIDVIGEAETIGQAVTLIQAQEPELVFLDIQMPGESGFSLLEQTSRDFQVIFVTAFDAYAIRAFEVNALDYLLKPINPARLAHTIERLTGKESPANHWPQSANEGVTAQAARKLEYEDRLFLEIDEHSRFLKINTIVCIAAAGDYSEIFTTDGKKSLVLKPLKEWEERLPEKYFTRIHRSAIINLEYIERIDGWFNRSYQVHLRHLKEPLVMSRRYAAKLKLKFG